MSSERATPHVGARLLGVILLEVLGIAIVGFGLVELYYLGGNPFRPSLLIPLGSAVTASGSLWFAKIYSGPRLLAYLREDGVDGAPEAWSHVVLFGTVLLFAFVGLVATLLFLLN